MMEIPEEEFISMEEVEMELARERREFIRWRNPGLDEKELDQKVFEFEQRIEKRRKEEQRQFESIPICARRYHRHFREDEYRASSLWRRLRAESDQKRLDIVLEYQRKRYIFPFYDDLVGLCLEDADNPTDYRLCELFLIVPVMWNGWWIKKPKDKRGFQVYETYGEAITRSSEGRSLSRLLLAEYLGRPLKRSEGAAFRDGNSFNLSFENMFLSTISGRPMVCYLCRKPTTSGESELVQKKRYCHKCFRRSLSG